MAEKQVLNIFVTDAGQGVGLAAVIEAARRGQEGEPGIASRHV